MRQWIQGLGTDDRRSLAGMGATVVLLHVLGFGVLLLVVAPQSLELGGEHPVFTVGVGLLAYMLGMRHAFDADHIAAIDNTTRKLIRDRELDPTRRRPLSVGFWFCLGHSSIVFALALLLAVGVKTLVGPVQDDSSMLHTITGTVGPSVSGVFLWVLGLANLLSLVGLVKLFRRLRHEPLAAGELEKHLASRGLLNRLLGPLTRTVRKPWHIFPVGVLFGLGFDTATEIGLLVLAGGAAAFSLPFYAILVLPVLFAAGMCLMDTLDGVFMEGAYGWASDRPVRTVFYNVTMTSVSVAVALSIGTIQLAGVVVERFHLTSPVVTAVADVNLDVVGYAMVALFLGTWALAATVWRVGRLDERWSGSSLA